MKVAIIPRDPSHSPNMESNDVEILAAVAKELEKAGATVTWLKQGEFPGDGTDIVCHMSRTTAILEILERAVQRGITIINSPAGVRHCSRSIFVTLLEENGIPQPQYTVVKSAKELEKFINSLVEAVSSGKIPMSRINDAVTRILTAKKERGLWEKNDISPCR